MSLGQYSANRTQNNRLTYSLKYEHSTKFNAFSAQALNPFGNDGTTCFQTARKVGKWYI